MVGMTSYNATYTAADALLCRCVRSERDPSVPALSERGPIAQGLLVPSLGPLGLRRLRM
jgi:hypothetical protein